MAGSVACANGIFPGRLHSCEVQRDPGESVARVVVVVSDIVTSHVRDHRR